MNPRKTLDLTEGPIMRKLVVFTIPILLSNLLQHLYHAADKAVVGQFAGKIALAAVGAPGTAITLLMNLVVGIATGANIVCANARGAGHKDVLRRSMHTSILVAAICGLVMCFVGIFVSHPMLVLMDTPETILAQAVLYMRIYFVGVPASLIYSFGACIVRANGDTKQPMIILSISGLANVTLNLVFVIFFDMAVAGVALATVISQIISAVWILYILFDPKGDFQLRFKELRIHREELISLLRVGVPCGLNGIVFGVSNATLQTAVNSFGDTVIAGNVAADGVTGLIYQILIAFYSGCISFSGQCYGAKKYKRIDRVLRDSSIVSCSIIVVVAIVATIYPRQLMSVFNQDPEVLEAGIPKLLICCWGYILYTVSEMLLGCLRGMRRSTIPMVLNICCICVLRLFWVFCIFPLRPTVSVLYSCYPITYIASIIALGIYYVYCRKQLNAVGDELPDVLKA